MAYSPQQSDVTPIGSATGSIELTGPFERHYFDIYFYDNADGIDPSGDPVTAGAGTGILEVSRDKKRWRTVTNPSNPDDPTWSVAGTDIMVRFAPGNYKYARFTPNADITFATHYRLVIDSDAA